MKHSDAIEKANQAMGPQGKGTDQAHRNAIENANMRQGPPGPPTDTHQRAVETRNDAMRSAKGGKGSEGDIGARRPWNPNRPRA